MRPEFFWFSSPSLDPDRSQTTEGHRSVHRKRARNWDRADTDIQNFSSHKDRRLLIPALVPQSHRVISDVALFPTGLDLVR